MTPCPSREQLGLLLEERLSEPETDQITAHIQTCATCQQALDGLASAGSLDFGPPTFRLEASEAYPPGPKFVCLLNDLVPNGGHPVPATGAEADHTRNSTGERWPDVAGYKILAELGRGGMGVVYKARQTKLDRLVALKMVLAGNYAGPEELGRFRREAEAVARLQHPHVVQIHEVGEADGKPFFSLEYVEGGSLDKTINATPQPAGPAAALVETLAHAVHAAHRKGIVHRDLKPANILLQMADGSDKSAICNLQSAIPKITDFGLAKQVEREAPSAERPDDVAPRSALRALTQSGAILGTPSYMAPEQASGPSKAIGPAADIYALGAILYELMTGRPPFRGETLLDTVRQVLHDEPVPPSRLNRKVPRDLETIALKCLAKVSGQRYATAQELAEDLRRFRAGEPIRARPVGRLEKAWRWCRRQPAMAGMLAAVSVLVVSVVAGAFWYAQDRLVRTAQLEQRRLLAEQGIGQALDQAEAVRADLQKKLRQHGGVFELLNHPKKDWQARLQMAQAGLDRARALLASADAGVDPALKDRAGQLKRGLQQDEANRLLAVHLEKIRMDRAALVGTHFNYRRAGEEYPRVFAAAGLAVSYRNPDRIVQHIGSMPIKEQVVAALDDWAFVGFALGKKSSPEKLLTVARAVAPDPAWGDRLRQFQIWQNQQVLTNLAKEAPAELSPQLLSLLGNLLAHDNPCKVAWHRQAQARFPSDFWLNFDLALALAKGNPVEAAGFYRVALTLRPGSIAAHNNLGVALYHQQQLPEAIATFHQAIALDPQFATAYVGLGTTLYAQHKLPEAIAAFHKAIALDPKEALAYNNLGNALRDQQQLPRAIAAYCQAIALDPRYALAYNNLGNAFSDQKKLPEAISAYRQAIALDPKFAVASFNLGNAFAAQQQPSQAIAAYRQAIAYDPKYVQAYYNLGLTLYSQQQLPAAIGAYRQAIALDSKHADAYTNLANALAAQQQLPEAIAAYQKALTLRPNEPRVHYNLGVALYGQQQLSAASAAFRQAVALDPRFALAHVALGQTLMKQGAFAEAGKTTHKALDLLPPDHGLRGPVQRLLKQCESLLGLEKRLPRVLAGNEAAKPGELLQMAFLCQQYRKRYASAVRLYRDAFRSQPALANDPAEPHRYSAACAAALAGTGKDGETRRLSVAEKAKFRGQALRWLLADLALYTQLVKESNVEAGKLVLAHLTHWQTDADLAGVREPRKLALLPEKERPGWVKLWADVRQILKDAQGP